MICETAREGGRYVVTETHRAGTTAGDSNVHDERVKLLTTVQSFTKLTIAMFVNLAIYRICLCITQKIEEFR